uniref:hypothetical protein n=1 Tax=Bordetella sputigena TaxID=1416810 RepID=UPI0039F0B6F3
MASASLDYFAGTQDMTFRVACGDDDKYCPNDETDTVGVRVTKVVILPVVDADLLRLRGRELFGGT